MKKPEKILFALGLGALAACQGDPKPDDSGPPITIETQNMIDDFEDGNGDILSQGLRGGSWFTYQDDTPGGMLTPMPNGEVKPIMGDNGYHLRLQGSGFADWGAGAGFHLAFDGNSGRPGAYDLSSFEGIAFEARGTVAAVSVAISLPQVLPPMEGGTCMDNAMMTLCHDVHKREVRVTNEWKQYKVKFSDLRQDGYSGMSVAWDPTMAIGVQFDVPAGSGSFEFFLDNIGLY